jgi:serralysin
MRSFLRIVAGLSLSAIAVLLNRGPGPSDRSQLIESQDAGPHSLAWYQSHFASPTLGNSVACFAPGTPADVVSFFQGQMDFPMDERYNTGSSWSSQGSPFVLTWSFVPDGTSIPASVGEATSPSSLFSRMDALFASQGGRAMWISRFQQCFDRWSTLTGMTYVHLTAPGVDWDGSSTWGASGNGTTIGSVRIGMHNIDGDSGILAYNSFPTNGDMVLDASDNWGSSSNSNILLRNTVMHEHGHGLGLAHVCPVLGGGPGSGRLMEPFINSAIDGPQHDEIRGTQRLYGDKDEPNNNAAAATNLGTIAMNTTITRGAMPAPVVPNTAILSIDADGEQDWFKFNVTSPARISTITLTPVGYTYDSSTQTSGGACNSGNIINSLTMQDLGFEIIGTDGVSVLGTANSQPAGAAESLSDVLLSGSPGTFYVRVFENSSSSQSQLYSFFLTLVPVTPSCTTPGDINNNGLVNADDIAGFVRAKLGTSIPGDSPACADMGNGNLDADIAEFVGILAGP